MRVKTVLALVFALLASLSSASFAKTVCKCIDCPSSSKLVKHFVRNPIVSDAVVEISSPKAGEVLYSIRANDMGEFLVPSGLVDKIDEAYVMVSVIGGYASSQPRHPSNVMKMLVSKDSFSRGSITISMSGTAAYLAAKQQIEYGNIGMPDFYDLYFRNLRTVSGGLLLPPGIGAEKAAYLNVTDEAPIELLPFTTEESVNLVLFDGLTAIDIMTASYEEQYEYLREFFGEMGGWENYWHKLNRKNLSGWPVQLTIKGESSVNVTIEKLDGTHVSTRNYQGEFISEHSAVGPQYRLPKIIVKNDERMRLELNPGADWKVSRWDGCSSETDIACVVARDTYEPSVLLLRHAPGEEKNAGTESVREVVLSIFNREGDNFVGADGYGYDITHFFFVASLSAGDLIKGRDGIVYHVVGTEFPSNNNESSKASQFKIKVREQSLPKQNSH